MQRIRALLLVVVIGLAGSACGSSAPADPDPVPTRAEATEEPDPFEGMPEGTRLGDSELMALLPLSTEVPAGSWWEQWSRLPGDEVPETESSSGGDLTGASAACRDWYEGNWGTDPLDWAEVRYKRSADDAELVLWVGSYGRRASREIDDLRPLLEQCTSFSFDVDDDPYEATVEVLDLPRLGDDSVAWLVSYEWTNDGALGHDMVMAVRVDDRVLHVKIATDETAEVGDLVQIADFVADRLGPVGTRV